MMVVLLVDAAVTSARVTVVVLDILGDFLSFGWAIKQTLELSLFWGMGASFFFLEYSIYMTCVFSSRLRSVSRLPN